jgi:DNA-binding transcriptional MerR regulator
VTIDELARRAGLTTRNVRAYQERGLLPPPTKVGRTGYYDDGHLGRLRMISGLLGRGYSLAAIADLLRTWEAGGDVGELLGLERALGRPWSNETPTHMSAEELGQLFPVDADALRRAVELGIVDLDGDGVTVPSMRMLSAGAELVRAGVPIHAVLDQAEALRADADRIAARFVDLVLDHIWKPFVAAGMPADRLSHITELVEKLRPLAGETLMPALAQAMERQVAAAASTTLRSLKEQEAS